MDFYGKGIVSSKWITSDLLQAGPIASCSNNPMAAYGFDIIALRPWFCVMRFLPSSALSFVLVFFFVAPSFAQQAEEHAHTSAVSGEGLGHTHMDISCSPAAGMQFDRALALLHNFWYVRALEGFQQVATSDPECAIAYWGAAMTYNHPFWDPPSQADEAAA